jgi:hypothetical protein
LVSVEAVGLAHGLREVYLDESDAGVGMGAISSQMHTDGSESTGFNLWLPNIVYGPLEQWPLVLANKTIAEQVERVERCMPSSTRAAWNGAGSKPQTAGFNTGSDAGSDTCSNSWLKQLVRTAVWLRC